MSLSLLVGTTVPKVHLSFVSEITVFHLISSHAFINAHTETLIGLLTL